MNQKPNYQTLIEVRFRISLRIFPFLSGPIAPKNKHLFSPNAFKILIEFNEDPPSE